MSYKVRGKRLDKSSKVAERERKKKNREEKGKENKRRGDGVPKRELSYGSASTASVQSVMFVTNVSHSF